MLNKQSLVYFRGEQEQDAIESRKTPLGRIFLSDVVTIDTEGLKKNKSFVFALHTKKRAVLLQAQSLEDRDSWVSAIHGALKSEGDAEFKDPFRRTLRRLAPGG